MTHYHDHTRLSSEIPHTRTDLANGLVAQLADTDTGRALD